MCSFRTRLTCYRALMIIEQRITRNAYTYLMALVVALHEVADVV